MKFKRSFIGSRLKRYPEKYLKEASDRISKVADKIPLKLPTDSEISVVVLDMIIRDWIEDHIAPRYGVYLDLIHASVYHELTKRGYKIEKRNMPLDNMPAYCRQTPWIGEPIKKPE